MSHFLLCFKCTVNQLTRKAMKLMDKKIVISFQFFVGCLPYFVQSRRKKGVKVLSLKQPSLLQVVTYVKIQQNKPSARLTDQLHKYITLSAKIRQIESKWFDFLSHATIVGKSTIQCTCHRVSSLYLKIYLQTLSFHVNRYYRSAVTCLF